MKEKKKIRITADCVCDLPFGMLEENDIDIIFFHIITENGRFYDRDEMTADNVFEHMDGGGFKAEAECPSVQEYIDFFRKNLRTHDKIVHITMSGRIGDACKNAMEATRRMGFSGEKVTVIDSDTISAGMGLLAMHGAEMIQAGKDASDVYLELERLKKRISTSFISPDAYYFYLNDRIGLTWVKIIEMFQIRPVFKMKDGKIKLNYFHMGPFQNAIKRYIKFQLRRKSKIDKKRIFLIHTACNVKTLQTAKKEIEYSGNYGEIVVTKASATVSTYCGPNTLAVLFIKSR